MKWSGEEGRWLVAFMVVPRLLLAYHILGTPAIVGHCWRTQYVVRQQYLEARGSTQQ